MEYNIYKKNNLKVSIVSAQVHTPKAIVTWNIYIYKNKQFESFNSKCPSAQPRRRRSRRRTTRGVAAARDRGQGHDGKALHRRRRSSGTARADQFAADAVVSCARATPSCCRGDVKGSDVPRTAAVPLQLP